MLLINYFLFFSTMIFLFLSHPLSLGSILLIQTIFIAMISGSMNLNYWFSYILFLIMIGGMLILFIYMTSIASNEKFKFSMKITFTIIFMSLMIFFLLMIYETIVFNMKFMTYEMFNWNLMTEYKNSMNKLFKLPLLSTFYMMIIYLFITLIMTVKITNLNYGPLRQKF
uniref:NADH-ubiquinone oxidoreductase chain 6 n=1 Tax=Cobelura sp. KM-2017 TaxID=2219490 RepID=A0A346RIY1_9CUCU|nr:NADH dehydrogenase subunit 6 [Cobelura sp. KM-2017]